MSRGLPLRPMADTLRQAHTSPGDPVYFDTTQENLDAASDTGGALERIGGP